MRYKLQPENTLISTNTADFRDQFQLPSRSTEYSGHAEHARPIKPPSCSTLTERSPVACQMLICAPELYAPFYLALLLLDDHWDAIR